MQTSMMYGDIMEEFLWPLWLGIHYLRRYGDAVVQFLLHKVLRIYHRLSSRLARSLWWRTLLYFVHLAVKWIQVCGLTFFYYFDKK